jgi:regulatory protein
MMGPGNSHRGRGSLPDSFAARSKPGRSVYDRALTLLGFRARSVDELRRRLLQKGADPAEVEEVLNRLCEQKVLNDDDFAQQYARGKLVTSGVSRRRIVQELARKGIPRDAAEKAVESVTENEGIDLSAAALRVASRKWESLRRLDDTTRRRRLYAFLARRGFNPDEIRAAMAVLGAPAPG